MERGRPTKLTPELQEQFVKVIQSGNYFETACAFVGLHKSTAYDWMKRGAREIQRLEENPKAKMKRSEAPYVEFSDSVKKALAQSEIRDVAIIGKAAEDNWQAAAWRLERKFADRWGRKDRVQADISHAGEIHSEQHINLSQQITADEESKELLKELWRRKQQLQGESKHGSES